MDPGHGATVCTFQSCGHARRETTLHTPHTKQPERIVTMSAPFPSNAAAEPSDTSAMSVSTHPLASHEAVPTATTGSRTLVVTQEQVHDAEASRIDTDDEEVLLLSLRARPSVRWDESVVDNEGLGRKNSKRCCIFHKERNFGESSTDSSDYDSDKSGSSTASGGAGGDGDKKQTHKKKRHGKIARPKKKDQVPDFQRFHA